MSTSIKSLTKGYLRREPRFFASRRSINIGRVERIASVVLGFLAVSSILRRRPRRLGTALAAAGGALLERGFSGKCGVYRGLHVTSA